MSTLSPEAKAYRATVRKRVILLALILIATVVLFLFNVMIGSSNIPLKEVIAIIFTGEGMGHNPMIVREVRLPMALMAAVIGAALGIGGCEIQTILRNPIASPYTLGITNAATFGAALGLILHNNFLGVSDALLITSNAFFFALLASVLVYLFSRMRGAGSHTIILFGMAQNFMFNAMTMVLQYISDDEDLKSLVFWSMGSLLKSTWKKFWIVAAVLCVGAAVFYKNAWRLTAMALDDTKAQSLGVNTQRVRRLVILFSSLLTAVSVCFVGTIGFVGMVAPHIARQITGEDQRFFMPMAALIGAVVVSLSFSVSKLVIPGVVLPIGLVTSIIGVPFFLVIIFRQMRYR